MVATLQKWGNSNAIRFPKVLLDELSLKENDQVDINLVDNIIQIKKTNKHKSLKERLKSFYGKDIKSYPILNEEELITGSVGDEL